MNKLSRNFKYLSAAIFVITLLAGCSLISGSAVDTTAAPVATEIQIAATPISELGGVAPITGEQNTQSQTTGDGGTTDTALTEPATAEETPIDFQTGTTETGGTTESGTAESTSGNGSPTPIVIPTTAPVKVDDSTGQAAKPSPIPLQTPTPSAILLTTAFTNHSKVTTVGIDEVFFGMLADEAAEAASTSWDLVDGSAYATCYQVTPASGPEGVVLWVVDGHMERVDVSHPDIRTPSSYGVGTTLEDLQNHLGSQLGVETITRADGSQFERATFTPSDSGDAHFRIIFDLEDGVVKQYRSGRVGVVEKATCSTD